MKIIIFHNSYLKHRNLNLFRQHKRATILPINANQITSPTSDTSTVELSNTILQLSTPERTTLSDMIYYLTYNHVHIPYTAHPITTTKLFGNCDVLL